MRKVLVRTTISIDDALYQKAIELARIFHKLSESSRRTPGGGEISPPTTEIVLTRTHRQFLGVTPPTPVVCSVPGTALFRLRARPWRAVHSSRLTVVPPIQTSLAAGAHWRA